MAKVSVIIPTRGEQTPEKLFLQNTITDVLTKARGDVEVIAVLDGYWPDPPLQDDKRLRVLHIPHRGMRGAINAGAAIARGEYLMKCDGHCNFDEGFDEVLKADCDDNWIVIPKRYSLDPETWGYRPKEVIEYHYLDSALTNPEYVQFHGVIWFERGRERRGKPEYDIDDTMSWQGSMWFMHRKHWNRLGGMNEYGYGTFSQEPQEIGLKTQLGGGRLVVNKKTSYGHLHKGKQFGRGYSVSKSGIINGHKYSAWYWLTNQWKDRVHDFEWLVEMYWPIPGWPDNWRELLDAYRKTHKDGPDP